MVSFSPLKKVSPLDTCSECWRVPQSFLSKDHKTDADGPDGNTNLHGPLSTFTDQNADIHSKQTACNWDRRPVSVEGTKHETSLFSSSLSDLFHHKLRLSESHLSFHQSTSNANSQSGHLESLKCVEETKSQAITNLLPDEKELLSGVIGLGHLGQSNSEDDFEDFDLFSSSGGIELEADDHIWAGNRNGDFNKGMHNSHWGPTGTIGNHNTGQLHHTTRILNGSLVEKGPPHKSSGIENTFHPSGFPVSAANHFSLCQASHSSSLANLDNSYMQSFISHSLPDVRSHVSNFIPWNSADSVGECPRVTEEISRDLCHANFNGKGSSLNGRAYGYSTNGSFLLQRDRCLSGKSDLCEHHPSSAVWPNSSSLYGEHAHCALQLPGFPKLPHAMMNVASPLPLQVRSAQVNTALWDSVEAFDDLSAQPYSIQSVAVHCCSPSHSLEMSSHHSYSHAGGNCMDISKHDGLLSQMSHVFNGRNPSMSMPNSFGSPNERGRNRANLNNVDKKNYELNIDRILRGEDGRTTLMIKNIPNKYTSKMLLATIDEQHKGKYDFIYLPIDFKNKCNVGYAFINVVDPSHIVQFYQTFNGKRWEKFNSEKVAYLAYARIQGKAALIAHFQNSSLMNEDKCCRPILFHTDGPNAGDQEPFPMSNNFRLQALTRAWRGGAKGGAMENKCVTGREIVQ